MPDINFPFYLVTGFHRSGTSLLAQTLLANGMNMGTELMGATFSNPLGHVEDMPVVRIHDKVYKLNGADWRYHDTSSLIKPVWLPNYLQSYIQSRVQLENDELPVFNGVKDPRAVHFLKDWRVAGAGKIKFIFIYRDWRTAGYSLLKRHSRHMLNTALPIEKHVTNLSFWQQPSLAYDMWLSANRRICDFVEAYPKECLLISQEAFISGETLPISALDRVAVSQNVFRLSTYKPDLLSSNAPIYCENMLPQALISDLNACYERLLHLSDLPNLTGQNDACSTNEMPRAYSSSLPSANSANIFENAAFDFSELTWSELSGALLRIPQSKYSFLHFYNVLARTDGNADDYFDIAKVAHMQGQWVIARVLKMRASMASRKDTESSAFDLTQWHMFVDDDNDWLTYSDDALSNSNPFSLKAHDHMHERFNEIVACTDNSLGDVLLKELQYDDESLSLRLSFYLLTSSQDISQLLQIARLSETRRLFDICEFACLKSLRLTYVNPNADMREKTFGELGKLYKYLGNSTLLNAVEVQLSTEQSVHLPSTLGEHELTTLREGARKPLRHRFAVLPHNLDYKKILSIGYENPKLGSTLDKLNQRLCFLAKDNETWLEDGTNILDSEAAKLCLKANIQSHWKKLWPQAIYDFMVGLSEQPSSSLDHSENASLCFNNEQYIPWLIVYDFEPMAFMALQSLLKEKGADICVIIAITSEQNTLYERNLLHLANTGYIIEKMSANTFPSIIQAAKVCIDKYNESIQPHWLGFAHCRYDKTEQSKQRLILNWYSMLGGEQAFSTLYNVDNDSGLSHIDRKPSMVLPAYAPWELNQVQSNAFYYPQDHMFWLNQTAFSMALQRTEVIPHRWLTKLLNNIKTNEGSLSFAHQRFLSLFQ